MIEENPQNESGEEETHEPLLDAASQKKLLYGAAILLLMAASFVAGRYSVQKSTPPNPFAQMPTPLPVETPTPVDESALKMVNFSGVSDSKKKEVLAQFNAETCSCGCHMTVAACIIKDPNCPMWKDHVTQFQKALGNGKKPDLSLAGKSAAGFPPMPNGMTGALRPAQMLPPPSSQNK